MNERLLLRQNLPTIEVIYDVLMDAYTFYGGIHFFHEAADLAAELVAKNPHVRVEVRKTEKRTQLFHLYEGDLAEAIGDTPRG